jgi:hypothetical protein
MRQLLLPERAGAGTLSTRPAPSAAPSVRCPNHRPPFVRSASLRLLPPKSLENLKKR